MNDEPHEDMDDDEPHEDMDEELLDDLRILGHDKEGGSSSPRRRNTSSKREFWEEWKIKHPWVYSINVVGGKTCMKCIFCENYKAQGPWGIKNGCNTIQYMMLL